MFASSPHFWNTEDIIDTAEVHDSSTLPLPLMLLSKDNIYPELGINHLPAYFCIFTMYVPIPETFTVRS